jgi:hypothetical protein
VEWEEVYDILYECREALVLSSPLIFKNFHDGMWNCQLDPDSCLDSEFYGDITGRERTLNRQSRTASSS